MMNQNEEYILNYLRNESIDTPALVNENLYRKNKRINSRSEFDEIKMDIDDFINGDVANRFLVLPGIRGVGKTTLLYEAYDYLVKEKNIAPSNIVYFSCDEINQILKFNIKEVVEIYLKYVHDTRLTLLDKKIFILIDESQYDENWALSGKIIFDKTKNLFTIFTGSSALNLEYNTDAARRMTKELITPLNYGEHIHLKYNITPNRLSESIEKIIFEGNVDSAIEHEKEMNLKMRNTLEYSSNDWDQYFKYGGFPILFEEKRMNKIRDKLVEMMNKVTSEDMPLIKNIEKENRDNAKRVLRNLSLKSSGDTSQNKLAKQLQTSSSNIKTVLDILEKTHLIFHCESYGSPSNRTGKSWKYYFATSSLKYALSSKIGNPELNTTKFEGILLENLVASTLYNSQLNNDSFKLYYDGHQRGNVDFIIDKGENNPIPIEVGRGKKDKKQIKNAIDGYNADHGIIISNTTPNIEKNNDIIYIPIKTFSFL